MSQQSEARSSRSKTIAQTQEVPSTPINYNEEGDEVEQETPVKKKPSQSRTKSAKKTKEKELKVKETPSPFQQMEDIYNKFYWYEKKEDATAWKIAATCEVHPKKVLDWVMDDDDKRRVNHFVCNNNGKDRCTVYPARMVVKWNEAV
jgi:hypothetical protein